ncbi:MAG TPA: cobyric acid synthase [Opitutaceae bacterium]|nr:cobyric acid synthase [Opitutaceae bacterium]
MKALGILGTGSSVGKTWVATALCAWLRRQGVRVAPCKTQNMSNNAWALATGGEISRAQAMQAEACDLEPTAAMNPILLKPSGRNGAQLILDGRPVGTFDAAEYRAQFEDNWRHVAGVLDGWRERCDVLVLEGAGSPVELNLMDRDLANLRPIRHLDGRWLLVGDIDRGGIFAQLAGTWNLLPSADRPRGLGAIVNRFRGDLALFRDAAQCLLPYSPGLPILGTVPLRRDLEPETEDGFDRGDSDRGSGDTIAWVRYPRVANVTDCQPWWDDRGVRTRWVSDPGQLAGAKAIVLPGSKNTLGDLRWLRAHGWFEAITAAARSGVLVVGLCGGYQMLGERLVDPEGLAGDAGVENGIGLLPITTGFRPDKIVQQVTAECDGRRWRAYEIHMGRSNATRTCEPLQTVIDQDGARPEGVRCGNVWGTYLHGWFEAPETRRKVAAAAGIAEHRADSILWAEKRREVYSQMADHLAAHVDLGPVRRYLEL